ncbi:MFS transporter [Pseudarthrobacter raffinosi]|uniref:MFS transporter n=1 Tax=Pseudarthrobacter raffinosi TaxID=2953651 RepID=UPI00208F2DB4|nr:aromatic acid/H+ symport family MFS transporter [Pseudarthrobacter sp. MDT3-9]MCO4251234.1 aromatic acid/H+ symport family MFS transporter [Pseudarthrobacter sp. MDT3-9]
MTPFQSSTVPENKRRTGAVIALCAMLVLFDGYDLILYGNVVPSLRAEPGWNLTPQDAGRIGSAVLVGMLVGALLAGTLADRLGRRIVIVTSMIWFSLSMLVCALAPNPAVFELSRALGGIGLGALLPTVMAYVIEFAAPKRRSMTVSLAASGYLVGGILAGVLGLMLIQSHGWRSMFWIGALPVLLTPLVIKWLPESPDWLNQRGRTEEAERIAHRYGIPLDPPAVRAVSTNSLQTLFSREYLTRTLSLWGIAFCSLLLSYGMVAWLPSIMTQLGYSLQSALLFSVILNVGAAAGGFTASWFADRGSGPKYVVMVLFILGGLAIFALGLALGQVAMYLLVLVAGAGTLGAQMLVNSLIGSTYPTAARATGTGWALGIGRIGGILGPILGGFLLGTGLPPQTSFYVFAVVAALGTILVLPIVYRDRRVRQARDEETTHGDLAPALAKDV